APPRLRAAARGSPVGRRAGARAAGQPPGRLAASQGPEVRGARERPSRGDAPRLLHRPRGARRAAPLARSVLGRRPALAQERRRSARPSVEEKAVNRTIQIAPVRRTIVVDATPERTFAVFTAGIDRWWPRGHGIGAAPLVKSVIEPFVGG